MLFWFCDLYYSFREKFFFRVKCSGTLSQMESEIASELLELCSLEAPPEWLRIFLIQNFDYG